MARRKLPTRLFAAPAGVAGVGSVGVAGASVTGSGSLAGIIAGLSGSGTITRLGSGVLVAQSAAADGGGIVTGSGGGNTIIAASASLADVQAAVDAAQDGDTVLIPNGTVTWTGGISTSKQIIIRAQNYTPTPAGTSGAGATTRNVTITNNSPNPLFAFTSGNTYHCGVGGIRVNLGTGGGSILSLAGAGSKVPLIFDCYFQVTHRSIPNSSVQHFFQFRGRGGVFWNCIVNGLGDPNDVGEGCAVLKLPNGIRDWTTPSTMGMLDDGSWNFYAEDCTFNNLGLFVDIDDHGRFVARRCIYDGAWCETHGPTSDVGGRHFEIYDTIFGATTPSRNLSGRYFWLRSGTGVLTGNTVLRASDTSSYNQGIIQHLNIGEGNQGPNGYPSINNFGNADNPGWGHNGTSNVLDPIYMWGNTGYGGSLQGWTNAAQWQPVVQLNRELYIDAGAKPGWSRFTYPHPFRSAV